MAELCTVKVDVYPDEFKPIMKAIKYALLEGKGDLFNEKEMNALEAFLDEFCSLALNEAV
jgi:hypothetical protein